MSQPEKRIGPPMADIVETEVGDDIGLYDPRTERVVVLNGTASDVWLLSDGDHTLDQIVALLASAYGVDPDSIRVEVADAVQSFLDQGLLSSGDE